MKNLTTKIRKYYLIPAIVLLALFLITAPVMIRFALAARSPGDSKPVSRQMREIMGDSAFDSMNRIVKEQLYEQDRQQVRKVQRGYLWLTALSAIVAIPAGAGGVFFLVRACDLRRTSLAQTAKRLAVLEGSSTDGALYQLSEELGRSLYNRPQFILTDHWLMGQVGLWGRPVAVPLYAVVGVYHCHLIPQNPFQKGTVFQLAIADRRGGFHPLRLSNEAQLQEVFQLIRRTCPEAEYGNYADYLSFCARPEKERLERAESIFLASYPRFRSQAL